MKVVNYIYKAIDSVLTAQSKHLTPKKNANPIKKASFDAPPRAKNEFFSVGYSKMSILPEDINKKKYYIAGYGENKPAEGVLDAPHTHAVWIDDLSGHGGIVIVSLDIVGMLNSDVNKLRCRLNEFAKLSGCRSINIVSTHNHAGIDTMGIWGKLPFSGKDVRAQKLGGKR